MPPPLHFEKKITLGNILNMAVLLGGVVYAFGQRDSDMRDLAKDRSAQSERIAAIEDKAERLKDQNSRREEAMDWIKKILTEMKDDIKDIRNHQQHP